MQHPSFWIWLISLFILFGGIVFVVEGLAHVIGHLLPKKGDLDRKSIGTIFE